jgi:hypothetical protein
MLRSIDDVGPHAEATPLSLTLASKISEALDLNADTREKILMPYDIEELRKAGITQAELFKSGAVLVHTYVDHIIPGFQVDPKRIPYHPLPSELRTGPLDWKSQGGMEIHHEDSDMARSGLATAYYRVTGTRDEETAKRIFPNLVAKWQVVLDLPRLQQAVADAKSGPERQ